ncbi:MULTISPECIES: ATP synthase subunit C [Thermotoga]|nr:MULTISPECIES: ATP synthase subunit C [Thermotoga]AJG41008.1 ATPase [Thermotoga sp. RQ7]KFZ21902.1 V-ATPase F-subunit [Thermotoga neapolitana LA10]BAC22092.1 V-ATPase F-subunit [Thermotoga neapolitana DSM 4359]HBF11626.1 ATPase [Thermotoga neapolitana]
MFLLVLATLLVVVTLASGIYFSKKAIKKKTALGIFFGNMVAFALLVSLVVVGLSSSAYAQNTPSTQPPAQQTSSNGLGLLAVALSTGLAAVGAGVAVGMTGAASIGAISEKPEMLGRTLIYVGLGEGIVIYGLIISIIILGRL